jgi:hypothetical protein
MPSLSDAQRLASPTAAERADAALLPVPDGRAVRGRARRLSPQGLIKRPPSPKPQNSTGWQPDTVRAAITRIEKEELGGDPAVTRGDGMRTYRQLPHDTDHAEQIA